MLISVWQKRTELKQTLEQCGGSLLVFYHFILFIKPVDTPISQKISEVSGS